VTKRNGKNPSARKFFKPDEKLIGAESVRFRVPPENLRSVLSAFGPIPPQGQCELLRRLYVLLTEYWYQKRITSRVTQSQIRNRLENVESAARRLLRLLGVNCRTLPSGLLEHLAQLTPGQQLQILQKPNVNASPDTIAQAILTSLAAANVESPTSDPDRVNQKLAAEHKQIAEAVVSVLHLHTQARVAQQKVRARKGRGGVRNRPRLAGIAIRAAITVYVEFRQKYPHSGNKPGLGGPMLKFVQAVAVLVGEIVTDFQIREVWRVRGTSRK
jgi:hypothetical protein